jgi:O-antigen ligase
MDAAVLGCLLAVGLVVLSIRRKKTATILKVVSPVIIYFIYCLLSTAWSPIHGPAFKRWIKGVGDLVTVLLIVTEAQPITALRRVYSRVGFVLLPYSVMLIRYSEMGRSYDPGGEPMNTGVTTNKNSLGLLVFIISLGAMWNVRALLIDKKARNRGRRLIAQGTLLAFGLVLLQMAHSATCVFCFVLGGGLMLALSLRSISKRPRRVPALCLGVLLSGALIVLFGGQSLVTGALGRDSTFTGRTEIWTASIAAAQNPIIGTGFESFWNVNNARVAAMLSNIWGVRDLNSAHDGYIQIYLDLGVVGLLLLLIMMISGYRRGGKAFQRDPEFGCLILAYLVTTTFYSVTEAGFRILTPSWIFLLLAVIGINGLAAGVIGNKRSPTAKLSSGWSDKEGYVRLPEPTESL